MIDNLFKDNNRYDEKIGKDEVTKRTNDLLERFKENYIKNNNNDFINDAITNMTVCCKAYEKIFEGFVIMSQINRRICKMVYGSIRRPSREDSRNR